MVRKNWRRSMAAYSNAFSRRHPGFSSPITENTRSTALRVALNLSQQLAALTSYGVRLMTVGQALDTDASNPSSRLCSR